MALLVPPRARRIAVAILAIFTFVVLAGATYQGVVTALERRQFPRPGGLVDVGDYQLHIYCVGEGSPTVVLEAAAGSLSPAWGWVQPDIGRITRVCSYDRTGLGWSEGDGRYLPSRVPSDLHMLLDRANEHGPVVLVGHELGASFARMYAEQYPADTKALVLIDDPAAHQSASPGTALVVMWPWLARAGILRATGRLSERAAGLPEPSSGAIRAFLNRPDHLTQAAREISRFAEVEAAARNTRLNPAITVTSVTIGIHEQPALLATREEGATVTRAIEETLARLRHDTSASPER